MPSLSHLVSEYLWGTSTRDYCQYQRELYADLLKDRPVQRDQWLTYFDSRQFNQRALGRLLPNVISTFGLLFAAATENFPAITLVGETLRWAFLVRSSSYASHDAESRRRVLEDLCLEPSSDFTRSEPPSP